MTTTTLHEQQHCPERCTSCNLVINQYTGECGCS